MIVIEKNFLFIATFDLVNSSSLFTGWWLITLAQILRFRDVEVSWLLLQLGIEGIPGELIKAAGDPFKYMEEMTEE